MTALRDHPRLAAFVGATLVFAALLAVRMTSPSDLNGTDQHRTIAYTLDMLQRGGDRLLLAHDSYGLGATKPPLYNWVGLPFARAMGPGELAFKLPAIVFAAMATALAAVGGWLAATGWGDARRGFDVPPAAAAVLAAAALLFNETVALIAYYARPDMPLVALCGGAWISATLALTRSADGRPVGVALPVAFWACVALGLLAKGPPALLPVLYVVIAAKLCFGRWSHIRSLWPAVGAPLAVAPFALWLVAAYVLDRSHLSGVLVGEEAERIAGGASRIVKDVYRMPKYFAFNFLPWSLLFAIGWVAGGRGALRTGVGPGIVFALVFVVVMTLPSGKRSVYLAPAYLAAASVAGVGALWLLARLRRSAWWAILLPIASLAYVAWFFHVDDLPARYGRGERLKAFAAAVDQRVGDDVVAFVDEGYHPLQSLLGRHQDGTPPMDARWVVRRLGEGEPVVVSGELWDGVGGNQVKGDTRELGLYEMR